jgi:hypothetical protein
MIRRVKMQSFALVFFFAFCQVIGMTCALPDLSVAADVTMLVEEDMACPMDEATMCPPSLTSSSERQIKNRMVSNVDDTPILLTFSQFVYVLRSRHRGPGAACCSIVPISIGSSSVLRI